MDLSKREKITIILMMRGYGNRIRSYSKVTNLMVCFLIEILSPDLQ